MRRVVVLDGKPYHVADILKLCKEQQAARQKAAQPPLFELRDDARPASQCSAAGRFQEPTLF